MKHLIAFIVVTGLFFVACDYREVKQIDTSIEFSEAAKAIIEDKCLSCHAGGNTQGGFGIVNDPDELVAQGYIEKGNGMGSLLYQKMSSTPPFGSQMPRNGTPLTTEELAEIETWIDSLPSDNQEFPPATVSFATDIKPLFENDYGMSTRCIQCHDGPSPAGGYALGADNITVSHSDVVAQNVVPGSPETSTLYIKLSQAMPSTGGSQMPRSQPDYFSNSDLQLVYDWINQGALDN